MDDTDWHHICYTYDGSTLKGYIDAVELVSESKSSTFGTGGPNDFFAGSGGGAAFAGGRIRDVFINTTAISASDVKRLYDGLPVASDVLFWPMNEVSGTIAIDHSGNGCPGTIDGATWDFGDNGGSSGWKNTDALDMGGDATDADTTLTVDDGSKFEAGDIVGPNGTGELILVGGVSTNDLTGCTRGHLGTTAAIITDNTIMRIKGDQQTIDGYFYDGINNTTLLEETGIDFGAGSHTIEGWLYSHDAAAGTVFGTANNGNEFAIEVAGGVLTTTYDDGAGSKRSSSALSFPCHFAVVKKSGIDQPDMYINGALDNDGVLGATTRADTNTYIGSQSDGSTEPYYGQIKIVRRYRELSALEIAEVYRRGSNR